MVQLFYLSMNECANMGKEFDISTIHAENNKQQYTNHKYVAKLTTKDSALINYYIAQSYATINHGMVQLFYSSMNECANMRGEFDVSRNQRHTTNNNTQNISFDCY